MIFKTDKQTYGDIELFSNEYKTASIFKYYNKTKTKGGQEYLYKVMQSPFTDVKFLENRKSEISFFFRIEKHLELNRRQLDYIEFYLKSKKMPLRNNFIDSMAANFANKLKPDTEYYTIKEGIVHLSSLLKELKKFLNKVMSFEIAKSLKDKFESAIEFIEIESINELLNNIPDDYRKIKSKELNRLDNLFRQSKKKELRELLDTIYEIDVLQTFSNLLENKQYCLPEYSTGANSIFEVVDFAHPLLDCPVKNSFKLIQQSSLCLITGPNMSGKSTFLKTIGILTYCAHLGIPVPARYMKISIFNGLFTTINLSDNINQGFSHFYAEVYRVKQMAKLLQDNNKIVVVLDELFRGTNVKDAYDGTLLIIESLSKIKNSIFFISTHIIEVAEELKKLENIDFRCFKSAVKENIFKYDYILKKGVTNERVGLQIIKSEGIEEILKLIIKNQKEVTGYNNTGC